MSPPPPNHTPPAPPKPAPPFRKAGSASISFEAPAPVPPPLPPPPVNPSKSRPARKTKRPSLGHAAYTLPAAWLLFVLLGGLMGALRYGNFPAIRFELTTYGPWVVLFFHVVVVFLAFGENPFTGFLCFLVPGYSLYYLVLRTGRPFLTALVFGLLVGVGEDSYHALRQVSQDTYTQINDLLRDNRRK